MKPKRITAKNLQMIEFTVTDSGVDHCMAIIYNKTKISEAEVNELIKSFRVFADDRVVVMSYDKYTRLYDQPSADTTTFDKIGAARSILSDFGFDAEGNRVSEVASPYCPTLKDITKSQAQSVKRFIDKLLNSKDLFCEMHYDASDKVATYDIVS